MDISDFNYLLAFGTLALKIVTVALIGAFVLRKRVPVFNDVVDSIAGKALWIAAGLSFGGMALTLYYSDVLGFEPCPLCWWQRIFLYPQVMLYGMAIWCGRYRETAIDASIALSFLGAGVALYHHALQMLPGSGLPCPATGPSCAQITFLEFGYITYPMMAFALFAFLIVTMLIARSRRAF